MDFKPQLSSLRLVCPVCESSSARLFSKVGYWIRGCDRCGHQFTEQGLGASDIGKIYDGAYFQGDGPGYDDYLAEAQPLGQVGQYYAKILRYYLWPGRVLDVGSAAGFVLQGLTDAGWQGQGLEPNARIAEFGQRQLGLQMTTGTLEEFRSGDRFDLVTMIQVVQHFYNLQLALQKASVLTKPGGHWLIETWNRASGWARLRGRHWHAYSPPSNSHWFASSDLEQLMAQFGFKEVARGTPQPWVRMCHDRRSAFDHRSTSRANKTPWTQPLAWGLQALPNHLLLPDLKRDRFWALFQKTV